MMTSQPQVFEFIVAVDPITTALIRATIVCKPDKLKALVVWALFDNQDGWTFCGSTKAPQGGQLAIFHCATDLAVDAYYK